MFMKRRIALALALVMLLSGLDGALAESGSAPDSSVFSYAIDLLRQLKNQASVEEAKGILDAIDSDYNYASLFSVYASVVLDIYDGEFDMAEARIAVLNSKQDYDDFADLVQDYSLQSLDALSAYIDGRRAEVNGDVIQAFRLYNSVSFNDATDRSIALINQVYTAAMALYDAQRYEEALSAFTLLGGFKDSAAMAQRCAAFVATPAPTSTPEPTPVPTPAKTASMVDSIGTYMGLYAVEVSSYRPASQNSGLVVNGDCVLDGDLSTAWNSYNESSNQWIRLTVPNHQRYEIGGLRIAVGYWKSSQVYYANRRPKEIDVYCDTTYVGSFTLADSMDYQTIMFREPVIGSSIQITVRSTYAAQSNNGIYSGGGSKDVCITELELIGPQGTECTQAAMDDWGRAVHTLRSRLLGGATLSQGSSGMEVLGLQLLLRDGLGLLSGAVDGKLGSGTLSAVNWLADMMRRTLPDCEYMATGTVDAAYWRNLMKYIDISAS